MGKHRTKTLKERNKQCTYYNWTSHNLDKVRALAAQGGTVEEIMEMCGVARGTFYKWLDHFPEFRCAVTEGRDQAKHDIEASLIKRACGYEFEEKEVLTVRDDKGNVVRVTERVTHRHALPSIEAIKHYQTNRDKMRWTQATTDVNINGGVLLIPDTKEADWAEMVKEQQEILAKTAKKAADEAVGDDDRGDNE